MCVAEAVCVVPCVCVCVLFTAPRGCVVQAFIKDFKELDGHDAWVIGSVKDGEGSKSARIVDDVKVVSV